ncbi:lipopolysaccharide biosynthesis protein [Sphingomonas sp.]|uniref:lipopolysaccharide biosynthesis protein n=1 Tax=Sphingomonas sp. TaxID=28214 RepID=UPI0035BBBE31
MYLVAIKLIEIFARAGFVAGITYSLGLSAAGQFGLVVTLIGLFALGFGWERHIDIQRRMAGEPEPTFDGMVAATVPFWGFNYTLMLPAFLLIAAFMAKLNALQLLLAASVVVAEHIANQAYQMSLIDRRYRRLVNLVAIKNLAVLAVALPDMLFASSRLTLNFVLSAWAIASVISTVAIVVGWQRIRKDTRPASRLAWRGHIRGQHRASFTHFRIGVVAFLMLQYDRLAVGTFAGLADAGIYFRHVLLIFFGYQLYTVASFNRITPAIFRVAKVEPVASLVRRLRREYLVLLSLAVGAAVASIALDLALDRAISTKYHLDYLLAAVLLTGTMLRIAADFAGMVVNARLREKMLGRAQLIAFACGGMMLAGSTWKFGILGAAIANVATSAVYLFLVVRALHAIPEYPEPGSPKP